MIGRQRSRRAVLPHLPECREDAISADPRVTAYATLLVEVAVNVQPGQRLIVWKAPVDAAWFVRFVVEQAYGRGASYVEVFWQDDRLERTRLSNTSEEVLRGQPPWEADFMEQAAGNGDAFLFFDCTCAGVFADMPGELISLAMKLENEHLQRVWRFFVRNQVNWSIATVPTLSWAQKVFPEQLPAEGLESLWEAIFAAAKLNETDWRAAWRAHRARLAERSDRLNRLRLSELHFSAPGTDLRVGLPNDHTWVHPGFVTQGGVPFVADIPIEEVFTLPHRERVEGRVRSTRPLVVSGRVIGEFTLGFEQGRVAEVEAEKADRELLRSVIEADEGAGRLGEVALVSENSAVSRLRKLFYNTVFDENAGCHLALGRAYRFCMNGGSEMGEADFLRLGGNSSSLHVDFTVGSEALDITGIDGNGRRVSIMRNGDWPMTGDAPGDAVGETTESPSQE